MTSKRVPTDLEILSLIYDRYYDAFANFSKESGDRQSKIFVPVDLTAIANEFKVDADIIFGRLYSHLNKKHGYKDSSGLETLLFAARAGNDKHCVNFPLAASVLADLQQENKKYLTAITMAATSLAVSIFSLLMSVLRFKA